MRILSSYILLFHPYNNTFILKFKFCYSGISPQGIVNPINLKTHIVYLNPNFRNYVWENHSNFCS